jgi:glucose/arabinose dehydrogenase
MFPEKYRGGAFVAFHGSWNRSPFPQAGYRVVFIPFEDGAPAGGWETFANGFAGDPFVESSGDAKYRPMGLAIGPEGELYISDSQEGRIWKITYQSH